MHPFQHDKSCADFANTCAMLPPHYHPRATNLVVAIEGTTNTYMIEETGATLASETLTLGKMTIFPQGSLHSMQNTDAFFLPFLLLEHSLIATLAGYGNATLISALNAEDAGTHNILNGLYGLPDDIILAAYGGATEAYILNADPIRGVLPPVGTGSIIGSADCLAARKKGGAYTGTLNVLTVSIMSLF
jgi:hypothetical protein